MCMSKQTLLNFFPFVWILTVGLCYFILIAFTLFFLPLLHITCWHQLQMEMMFHQFGNYRILINKIFPMELVFGEVFLLSSIVSSRGGKPTSPVAPFTLVHGGNKNQSLTLTPPPHLPKINPSPQGSGLHRWVCSDTLVRLKSQAGFINLYSGRMDTPFCIVTKGCINLLCPSVLQNYISSYMIKSDWLQSVSPLNLPEPPGGLSRESSVEQRWRECH